MKSALITGGVRGIGRAIARCLCGDGLRVVVADRDVESEAPSEIRYYKADVGSASEVANLARELESKGGIDVLINNAGVRGPTALVTDYPVEEWEAVLRVNLTGAFLCCRAFAPAMQKKGWGRIINISSMAGKVPYPLRSAYAASKWGLIGFTLTLAQELGPRGITVNAVCPGPVNNAAMQEVMKARADATGKSVEEVRAEYLQNLAIPQLPMEEDVARMVSYLVSDAAWSITGQAVEVSSGYRA
jgi:NAD(P)-dependent dehydrogenase (short-subunit alcohol dehydrogenase family)